MAYRDFSSQTMIGLSKEWVDPQRSRPTLESYPILAGGLEAVDDAHENLVVTRKRAGSVEKEIEELTDELTQLDALHDRKGSGVHKILDAGVELADDPAEAELYRAARDKLFPNGAMVSQGSYLEQAGAAAQARKQLTPDTRAFLAAITVGNATLLDHVLIWLDAGDAIGEKVNLRAQLTGDSDNAVDAGDVYQARMQWIRATHALVALLELSNITPDDRRHILASLHEAERNAALDRPNPEDLLPTKPDPAKQPVTPPQQADPADAT
jgi:hypothetical protein